jgi:hypothetical protein
MCRAKLHQLVCFSGNDPVLRCSLSVHVCTCVRCQYVQLVKTILLQCSLPVRGGTGSVYQQSRWQLGVP